MNVLTWFDNRTILAFSALVAAAFGLAILSIHRAYPRIRGVFTIACAFLLVVPATGLIAARGFIPFFLSVVVGNILVYGCYFIALIGLHRYFGQRDHSTLPIAWTGVILGSAALAYYGVIDNRIVPRIVTIAAILTVLRALLAITIARNAAGSLHRKFFVAAMICFGLISAARIPLTLLHGAPQNYMQQNAVQTYNLLLGVLTLLIDGLCFFSLFVFDVTHSTTRRATEDSLTGVFNRRAIEDKLHEELARSARTGRVVCALLIDIDHFKTVNDTYGHAAGDQALKQVAATISSTLRPFDHLGRFGGDEFLLILPELRLPDALIRAEFLRQSLAPTSAPTLSIGIAESEPGESAPVLLARADTALYAAKHAGRDCVRLQPANSTHPASTENESGSIKGSSS